jgi:putative ABC transport system permease protein
MRSPPRVAALLLRLAIRDPDIHEALLGDLEEELAGLQESERPPGHPRLWYWKAILGLSRRFVVAGLPGGGRASSASPIKTAKNSGSIFETLTQDLRYAIRGLRKSPGFTVASVLTLTVGIGANVAIFSVIEPTLLRPLPYPESDRLVLALGTEEGESWTQSVSAHDYVDLRDRSDAFASLGAISAWPWLSSVTGGQEPVRLPVGWVSVNLFAGLGVEPILGRGFAEEEGLLGAPGVAMVSHGLWEQNFGSDPEVVGRAINIDGTPFTVIGVMPPNFSIWVECDIWMPMRLGEHFASDRRYQNFVMVGRLRSEVPLEQAQSQADVIAAELAVAYPTTNQGEGFRVTELQEAVTQSYRASLLLLLGSVGLLLLIASGNLAALLLARGFSRQTEFSVRVALGASRTRLIRQVLTESVVVSFAGGVLGTGAALAAHGVLLARLPFQIPAFAAEAGLSLPILVFGLLLSAGTGILIGIIPGIRSSRRSAMEGVRSGPRSADLKGTRIRSGLVVAQVALSMVLLIGSALLIRSFVHLRSIDPGFDAQSLLAIDMELPASEYLDAESRTTFFTRLDEGTRAIPGVVDVAMVNRLPIRAFGGNTYVYRVGERPGSNDEAQTANERWVMPGYFQAMGIPILRGRGVETTDAGNAPPVLVINETMAREFFPGEDPIGQTLIIDFDEETHLEVVGVVGDVRFSGPTQESFQAMYHSYLQEPVTRMALAVRFAGEAPQLVPALKAAVRELDPTLPVSEVEAMERVIARAMGDQTLMAVVLSLFAWVAALLTALGIYGVLAYYVGQRVPELGLRMALGAGPGGLIRTVASRGLLLLAVGMVLGIAAAVAATRLLQGLLFGVESTDPVTFLVISGFFLFVGAAASLLPARRAVKIDPVKALHAE